MAQSVITKAKKSVHTRVKIVFFVGLVASGFGFLPAALKQQFPNQTTQQISPAPIEQKIVQNPTPKYIISPDPRGEILLDQPLKGGLIVKKDGGELPINTPSTSTPAEVPLDCHGASYPRINPAMTYLILTRPMFVEALTPFITAKEAQGEVVQTLLVDDLACLGEGRDVQEKIRFYLRQIHNATPLKNVLIVGSPVRAPDLLTATLGRIGSSLTQPWEVPMRYVKGLGVPIPTDQYYASLNDSWSTGLDDIGPVLYAEVHNWQENFDFHFDLMVGRVPVRNAEDLTHWINKTLHWRVPTAFKESKFVTVLCREHRPDPKDVWESSSTHMIVSHGCEDDTGGDIANYVNREQPDLVSSYSHGEVEGITRFPLPIGYTLDRHSPGFTKAPILFVHGCEVGGVDYPEQSLAESYIARADGIVAFIGATRSHYDTRFQFQDQVFNNGYLFLGEAFYQAKMHMVADRYLSLAAIDNLFMYSLYGDPGLKLVEPAVTIHSTSSIVHVPAITHHEPFSLPFHLTSSVDGTLTGGLSRRLEPYIDPIEVVREDIALPARGSTDGTLRSFSPAEDPLLPRLDYPLPAMPQTIQFSSSRGRTCDTSRMTCIASKIVVAPPVYLSCARLGTEFGFVDGVRVMTGKTAKVKLLSSALSPAPLTFVLTLYPGVYLPTVPGLDVMTRRTGSEVARMRVERPEQNGVYQFSFTRTPASTLADPSYTGTDNYWNPLFKAEAYDDAGHRQGWCWYYGWEPDIEGVFAGL